MKFLVDMPLSPQTVSFLKNMGYEAIRVSELGMSKSIEGELNKGVIVIIEDTQIRIRELPIGKN